MKHNLKRFPKLSDSIKTIKLTEPIHGKTEIHCVDYTELSWKMIHFKENLEKELQQLKQKVLKLHKRGSAHIDSEAQLIDEILGENQHGSR